MWEALCQGLTIISLIKSLQISSDLHMIIVFTSDQKTAAQEKMVELEITQFPTGLQILEAYVRFPFCQMINQISKTKYLYLEKLKK